MFCFVSHEFRVQASASPTLGTDNAGLCSCVIMGLSCESRIFLIKAHWDRLHFGQRDDGSFDLRDYLSVGAYTIFGDFLWGLRCLTEHPALDPRNDFRSFS